MSIFRRKPTEPETEGTPSAEAATEGEREAAVEAPPAGLSPRPRGPWDVSEPVEDGLPRVDLGALHVPGVPGMELRLEVEDGTKRVVAATVALAGSTAQLQVFAAPRTHGIWHEVRAEIAASLAGSGGSAEEVPGEYGTELLARVPVRTPDGQTGLSAARFVGVDGPRWFLRAVISGPAAVDSGAADPLEGLLRSVVVVRGSEAMAPRDLLPLRLPQGQPGQQPGQQPQQPQQPVQGA